MKRRIVYTPHAFNFALGVIGLVIIWVATHNWIAILGAIIGGIHLEFVGGIND